MMYGHEHRDYYNGLEKVLKQADTVSRQEAKKFLVDVDLLMLKVEEKFGFRSRDRLYELIRDMDKYELPSEIIYCEDCKYWNSGSCECPEYVVNCQDYYVGDIETDAKHFCGYGKRKEVII